MRVLVFCLGLSLCLHGGWLMLSKASASVPAVAAISLTDMPKLRISEHVKTKPLTAVAPAKKSQRVHNTPVVEAETVVASALITESVPAGPVQSSSSEKTAADLRIESQAPRFRALPTPPQYPQFARRQQQTGVVVLAVYLDAKGQQERRQIMKSSGYQLLDQAAEKAVSRWQFLPEIHAGSAVPSRIEIPIQFALSNPS
ncbi:MAG: energy transducer TonB [Moraxellaceae bacterium]|nr:energy transducer TonB [Moraxellaceae bacterium]MDP1775550.1 energy transducer TonB [Moraxellaceae bacterium]MDZ4298180.1 energy transducer TonB [Moraxellaceae bacterium]MDZ4386983.1 energy transducer TonB [Moraxellaceae bacterium]